MVRTRRVKMSFQEVKKEYMRICEELLIRRAGLVMHQLAVDNEFKDLERLESCLMSSEAFDLGSEEMTASELDAEDLSLAMLYLRFFLLCCIPLYGAGGDGKSMAAWALAKHISLGLPFEVQNNVVPIKKGKVLILNADQPKVQLREQLREQDYKMDDNTVVINGFQIKREYYFAQLIKKHKPTLVVIDSLIGSSAGRAFDETEFLCFSFYRLTNNNGHSFPATTILVIHHASKQGGFRYKFYQRCG